ncbi:4,5-DOPA dioxygenase extradiol [Altericroceibacterium endophyticum]|uniref:4,5-DOPA dioxygenase extradiol n=1 Tax=Altericroceibacterium endophyticum TaxID=1808508 RepID=A0A6I4T1C5_9SPHN|nr:4,5-DOPA dioxygenase extradiol [Altericroceibacterium endophyticum]MXO64757.1 4,5-DOPA dioxygenase extradiol [Altericroceibacterium endophyticum]
MSRMPALFVGHGSPTNTFDNTSYTRAWRALGANLPRPKAILVISGHWYFGTSAVTAMKHPRTIHDFYGFSAELNNFQYPAPGDPELAHRIVEMSKPLWVGADNDQWGLDHGTWSVLAHMYPDADIPVLQLSINGVKPLEYHLELGAKLAALRDEGVMILGTGNIVHNLGVLQRHAEHGEDWAERFEQAAIDQARNDPANMLDLLTHPDFAKAVPTPDHFIPVLYIAGLAAAAGEPLECLIEGCVMGSLSMTTFGLDCDPGLKSALQRAAEAETLEQAMEPA